MDGGTVKLTLAGARDNDADISEEYEAVERTGLGIFEDALSYDSAKQPIYGLSPTPIIELLIPAAQIVAPLAGTVIVAWLNARSGRKISIKFDGVEVEANTADEVERLLNQIASMKSTQGSPKQE